MANYSIFHIEQQISEIKNRLHNINPDADISNCSPELERAINPIMGITMQQVIQCRDLFLKLFSYYLSIYKEIYILASHKAYKGAAARYRILIEIYCIYKYFTNFPESIPRFADHYFLKDYLNKKKYNLKLITSDDISMYNLVRERYSTEYKTYKLNYGWIIHKVVNYNSIKELMKYALKDDLGFVKKEYDLYSEYSHASLFVAMQSKDLNILAVLQFLCKSGGLSIYMARYYINFLIKISGENGHDLYYLFHFLELLSGEILKIYNPKQCGLFYLNYKK
ncbi:hypothetical protein AGMMS50268_28740 [Spirochaetia bacterium]|nr:hypothetical protein AGMMS50268_28740 [Spirochaetia bacterium]